MGPSRDGDLRLCVMSRSWPVGVNLDASGLASLFSATMETLGALTTLVYDLCLWALVAFGIYRALLVRFRVSPSTDKTIHHFPVVTVQLPVFNEAAVIERLIRAACSLDWPGDRLEVQV